MRRLAGIFSACVLAWVSSIPLAAAPRGEPVDSLAAPRGEPVDSLAAPRGEPIDFVFASSFEPRLPMTIDLTDISPPDGATLSSELAFRLGARFVASGTLPAGAVRLLLDGSEVTTDVAVDASGVWRETTPPLPPGVHHAGVIVGETRASWSFRVAQAPQVLDFLPDASLLPPGSRPTLSARIVDAAAGVDASGIRLMFGDTDVTAQSQIQFPTPNAGTIAYTPPQPLAPGTYTAILEATNRAGMTTPRLNLFTVDTAPTWTAAFASPVDGASARDAQIVAAVVAAANKTDVTRVTINGTYAPVVSYNDDPLRFATTVRLTPGENVLTAVATFGDGQERTTTARVTYDAPPQVTITAPADFATLGPLDGGGKAVPGGATNLTGSVQRPATITGVVSRRATSVTVNQQAAQLAADGRSFTFERFFLHEGTNLVSANATDEFGRVGTAQITVYVDQTAPLLTVEGPLDDAVTSAVGIDLRGVANDAVEGGQGAPEPQVVVHNETNGQSSSAVVANRYWLARDVPLAVGANKLAVTATDALGNARRQTLIVTRIAAGSRRITRLSGDRQTGAIDTPLPAPLRIAAIDRDGLPLVDLPVHFDVLRGSGALATSAGSPDRPNGVDAARNLVVRTDASGQAQVWATLGNEAAHAANMVRAWSPELAEDVVFSATGVRGAPAWVLVSGMAGTQYAATNAQPVEAPAAVVLDAERNPVVSVPVHFAVEEGDAVFNERSAPGGIVGDGGQSIVAPTDKNGMASARPVIGATPGVVAVRARAIVDGTPFGAADFQIVALARGDGPTGFAGVVLDHTGAALPGVRLSISRTTLSAVSDADGRFRFDDQVPPGKIDLHVDGTAIRIVRDGQELQYPGLHFETAIVQGQLNQLPHPIYLPPVNVSHSAVVGDDDDVRLTIPGLDGFEMLVKARSVTFPDGSTVGPVVVTPVHGDRLPMVPPGGFGSFGAIAWTIQPTGTRFDPPIRVTMPNTLGLARGETLPIVQWDHDLAAFVPMGRGTVSEDGTRIVSDAGSGITKAGWGGGPPPPPPNCGTSTPSCLVEGTCSDCPACKSRQSVAGQQCPVCRADPTQVGKSCENNACRRCNGQGGCVADPQGRPEQVEERREIKFSAIERDVPVTGARAVFRGLTERSYQPEPNRPPPSDAAKWTFEVKPVCTPEGKWKFKVSKAEMATVILHTRALDEKSIDTTLIRSLDAGATSGYCALYRKIDVQLRISQSSHYRSPLDNTQISSRLDAGWGRFAGAYHNKVGTTAHERVHYKRFKQLANQHWASFRDDIERLELPILENDTPDAATTRIKSRVKQVQDAYEDLIYATTPLPHENPNDFYVCGMGALRPEWTLLGELRESRQCDPADTEGMYAACPPE
jgi:hypothetical protein